MALRTLIVDLDGTLWDSATWLAGLVEPNAEDQELIAARLRDPSSGLSAAGLLNDAGLTKHRFARLCGSDAQEIPLYESADAVLQSASEAVHLGVVTSLPAWIARPMLERVGLLDLFDVVQCAEWGVPSKPSPAGLKRALAVLDEEPRHALYVGDSGVDQVAAAAAGMSFAWASWGYGSAVDPERLLNSWQDVRGLL